MEQFTQPFSNALVFVYHCFDCIVINGYLSGLSRPEQAVHFVREVLGIPVVSTEDRVLPALRRLVKKNAYGVCFIFKSME